MKYDAVRSAQEMRQVADVAVVAAVGWLASVAFGYPVWLTVAVSLMVFRPQSQQPEGMIWKRPALKLAVVSLILIWLWVNYSSYQQGVFAGYDAAQTASRT